MQQCALLAYLRDAVLDGIVGGNEPDSTINRATTFTVLRDIGQVREETLRLSAYLASLNRQYSLQSSLDMAVRSLNKLPSTSAADNDSTAVPPPTQFVEATEIKRIQNQLITSQSTLLNHYVSLLQFVAESYVFPVFSTLEFSDSLDSIHKPPADLLLDIDSLLFADTSELTMDAGSFAGVTQSQINKLLTAAISQREAESTTTYLSGEPTVTLEEHNNIVSSIASALDLAEKEGKILQQAIESERKEKESLQQAVTELETSVLDISAKQSDQQSEIRRQLEDVQARLLKTQSELETQLDLHTEKDKKHAVELQQVQRQLTPFPPQVAGSESPALVEQLQSENSELQLRIAQLENDIAAQTMQHGAEFETMLMQNASLNERLAEMDTKKSNRNSVSSSPVKSVSAAAAISTEHLTGSGVNSTDDPSKKIDMLQKELHGLASRCENLMSRSLEYENERAQLEREIVSLRDKNQRLEAKILDNRVKVLANHTNNNSNTENIDPYGSSSQSESATIGILRKEFRKLVAEMKSDHAAVMKAEFEERRRLEKVIRDMKRSLK
ncbi:uncharacterized protein V1513DRAFT_142534 [Lipomyces chichibuensis]|uniref:uncharacterized protein n=1 Tax=Lipomyces chichibuensis TaxID=1546026 RepID=UPI0033440E49